MARWTLEYYKAKLSKREIWLHRIQRAEAFEKDRKNK